MRKREAAYCTNKAIALNPQNFNAWDILGHSIYKNPKAADELSKAQQPPYWERLGNNEKIAYCNSTAITLNQNMAHLWFNLGINISRDPNTAAFLPQLTIPKAGLIGIQINKQLFALVKQSH